MFFQIMNDRDYNIDQNIDQNNRAALVFILLFLLL